MRAAARRTHIEPVVEQRQAKSAAQIARAAQQRIGCDGLAATAAHRLYAMLHRRGSHQHRTGDAVWLRDQVGAVVHAV